MLPDTRDKLDRSNLYHGTEGAPVAGEIDDLVSLYHNEVSCLT